MTKTLSAEAQQLLDIGFAQADNPHYLHLRSKLTVLTYLRIADEITAVLPPANRPRLLDWGAGAGQMAYLLTRRGFDVTGFDYLGDTYPGETVSHTTLRFGDSDLPLVASTDPVKLPFPDQHFDAVLSNGVLEHVTDDRASLGEIRRVLKPGGFLFVYQLPQQGSWLEFFIRRFKLGYYHERRYTGRGIRRLLHDEGFTVLRWKRANMLPKNFTGLPRQLKRLFELQPYLVLNLDRALARVPLLNLLGGVLELTARKP